jgi:O-acetyl-ADP-ribose deacetylase (regulator of RNase III)
MITYIKGDVTCAPQQLIAHGCNCSGGFGSGVAGAIKKKHPPVREAYLAHKNKVLGTCQYVDHSDRIWVNAFTQQSYGYDGKQYADLTAIGYCLADIADYMAEHELHTIAMPKIGCGLGGLNWDQVGILVENLLEDYEVFIYEL